MRPLAASKAIQYIRDLYAKEDKLLQEIHEALVAVHQPIHIGPEEGKFLQLLIQMIGAKRILEIGTLYGYSTIWMGRALPEEGKIISLEHEDRCVEAARSYVHKAGLDGIVDIIAGDACTTLQEKLSDARFDMIFMDADKLQYELYLELALPLLNPGGLIVADNTLLFDSVYEDGPIGGVRQTTWEAMRRFNAVLADPSRFASLLLPTKEGLTLAIKQK